MNGYQFYKHLENIFESGDMTFQLLRGKEAEDKKEAVYVTVVKNNFAEYSLVFEKDVIEEKSVFSIKIITKISGTPSEIDIQMTDEIFDNIKKACLSREAKFLADLQKEIETIENPESTVKTEAE